MPEWNWRAVCEECTDPSSEKDWRSVPKTSETHASIVASTHDRRKHNGSETADVVEVGE